MKRYRIEEVCRVKSSKRIYASDYSESGVPFFRGKEITELSKNKEISDVLFITEERFRDIDEKFGSPRIGDILMTAVGTLGNVWMVDILPIYFKDGNLIWFSDFKTELINPNYLKLLFESRRFQDLLLKKGTIGSVQSALTIEKVKKLSLTLPSLELQNNIFEEISRITNLSLLNYKIIRELEEYSQLLFHKWFVDFNFPNENGEPYKDSGGEMIEVNGKRIPVDWDVKILKNCIQHIKTGLNPRDNFKLGNGNIKYVTVKNLTADGLIDFTNCELIDSEAKEIINRRSQINIGDVLFASISPLGRCSIIYERANDWEINESVFSIRPNTDIVSTEYLFRFLMSGQFIKKAEQSSVGSIFNGIRIGTLENMEIVVPCTRIRTEFKKIISPILRKKYLLNNENISLQEYRDLLINKLIK